MSAKRSKPAPMHAGIILDLLAAKHTKDLFVPECKDGPTWSTNHFRMDAWVLRRSWAHPCITGYEIKVSRSDFRGDEKWPAYLACCNKFYFACPEGLIQPEELPTEVGLLWATRSGGRLYAKRKAVYRPVQIPDEVYRYVLMSRVEVTRNRWRGHTDNVTYWRSWLEDKRDAHSLGRACSRKIHKVMSEKVHNVECKQRELEKRLDAYEDVRKVLREMGITDNAWISAYSVQQKIQKLRAVVPEDLTYNLRRAGSEIENALAALQRLEDEAKAKEPEEVSAP